MGRKRRLIELGKDLVILLLTLSAVWLLGMTPLVQDSGLLEWLAPPRATPQSQSVTFTAAAHPVRITVGRAEARYGVQYDQDRTDELFARLGPLLGEALITSGQPETISQRQWQGYLRGECVSFDFAGSIPLSALASWLQQDGQCALAASARRLALAVDGDGSVLLCYRDEDTEQFRACATGLSRALHLGSVLDETEGNGARFAFENSNLSSLLDPYTLLCEDKAGAVYAASTPVTGGSDMSQLLEALHFNGQNRAPVSGGTAYLDGDSRLEVTDSGFMICRAGQQGKYPVAAAGAEPTVAEMIETVRGLAQGTLGTLCGAARLYLSEVLPAEDGGYCIRFRYQLNGSTVWLYDDGWAAEFFVQGGYVTEFTLRFRSYTATGNEALLLPAERAAVILPGLSEEKRELVIQYRDRGGAELEPIWVGE